MMAGPDGAALPPEVDLLGLPDAWDVFSAGTDRPDPSPGGNRRRRFPLGTTS